MTEKNDHLLDTAINVFHMMHDAGLTNGESIDLISLLLAFELQRAHAQSGPDAVSKGLERFLEILSGHIPGLECKMMEKK